MKVYIKVKEAIAFYNRTKKPKVKMTMATLGEIVFANDARIKSPETMKQYLSGWNNGYHKSKEATVAHCAIIAKVTGYPICELIFIDSRK